MEILEWGVPKKRGGPLPSYMMLINGRENEYILFRLGGGK